MSSNPKPADDGNKGGSLRVPAMLLCGGIVLPLFSLFTISNDPASLGILIVAFAILLLPSIIMIGAALFIAASASGPLWAKIIIITLSSIVLIPEIIIGGYCLLTSLALAF